MYIRVYTSIFQWTTDIMFLLREELSSSWDSLSTVQGVLHSHTRVTGTPRTMHKPHICCRPYAAAEVSMRCMAAGHAACWPPFRMLKCVRHKHCMGWWLSSTDQAAVQGHRLHPPKQSLRPLHASRSRSKLLPLPQMLNMQHRMDLGCLLDMLTMLYAGRPLRLVCVTCITRINLQTHMLGLHSAQKNRKRCKALGLMRTDVYKTPDTASILD